MGGNSVSIEYAVPVTEKKPGESPIYRFPDFKDGLREGPEDNIKTMKEAMINAFKLYGGNTMLGKIIREEEK